MERLVGQHRRLPIHGCAVLVWSRRKRHDHGCKVTASDHAEEDVRALVRNLGYRTVLGHLGYRDWLDLLLLENLDQVLVPLFFACEDGTVHAKVGLLWEHRGTEPDQGRLATTFPTRGIILFLISICVLSSIC